MTEQPTSKENTEDIDDEVMLYLSIHPQEYRGKKILEFRGQIHDKEKVLKILKRAFNEDEISAALIIRDKFKAYLRCVELGFFDPKVIKIK